ncbi:hypothetical protein GPECTOR_12g441 [Gonium pectorale]|uniref:Elongation factor Tu, chloroplastic n=1 Tax=Gonium pectorale TaxID=33097 RepID=A0A150GP08_GONPE|nr:hypothetical protein GPECTOR_12g441 [Gonium pectorale]|eukprot:KXZ51478.1 hypothetical protein GPECTOR_12g441 [Gonium pectorale]
MAHHGKHHASKGMHHLSTHSHDTHGWVEGITSLKADDGAVELLAEEPERRPAAMSGHASATAAAAARGLAGSAASAGAGKAHTAQAAAAAAPGSPPAASNGAGAGPADGPASGAGGAAGPAPGLVSVTRPEDFEAVLQHALEVMVAEIVGVGEMVLEVGAPLGWGPVGLTTEQLAVCLGRIRDAVEPLEVDSTVVQQRTAQLQTEAGPVDAFTADVLLRRRPGPRGPLEVRVAIIGNVDSGKSTMVGVLTRSMLDDGRGLARSKVFKHHHEEATGRTSSIGQHTLCLDSKGNILNDTLFRTQTCSDYIARASKVMTLVDLAGHERYFRTTAYGLTGHLPDYACLIVGANMGVVGMCKEHLGVALALKVPVFFVVTKVDIAPEHILKQTVQNLASILKKPGVKKKPFLVRSMEDVLLCARNMNTDSLAPIFLTSAVTGKGLDLVRLFYNLLPQRHRWVDKQAELAEFVIDETFGVPGVGTVVAGTVKRGIITPNTMLLLGPDIGDGSFKSASIKSIHYKRLPVGTVVAGQTAALALKKTKRSQVRKGMVLVDERLKPAASWEFDADIAILTHSTTIQPRYQAVIHCEIIRQAARVVAMDRERLRSGDRACVRFRFIQRPEYVTAGTRFVFREGRTKGIGIVVGTEHQPADRIAAAAATGAPDGAGTEGEGPKLAEQPDGLEADRERERALAEVDGVPAPTSPGAVAAAGAAPASPPAAGPGQSVPVKG